MFYPWFQASAAILMKSALFWNITRGRVVILYRRFGTTYRSHLQGSISPRRQERTSWPLKMGPMQRPETPVKDYHSSLRNIPEERRSQINGLMWKLYGMPVIYKFWSVYLLCDVPKNWQTCRITVNIWSFRTGYDTCVNHQFCIEPIFSDHFTFCVLKGIQTLPDALV
jgi:hypothetical protein